MSIQASRKMTVAGSTDLKDTDELTQEYRLYPVPVKKGQQLTITGGSGKKSQLQIINKEGRVISSNVFGGRYVLETKTLSSGIYYVRIVSADRTVIKKFMIID